MKKYQLSLIAIILSVIIISGCKKKEEDKYFASTNSVSLYGKVYDQNNEALSGVIVKLNDKTTVTDSEGAYKLSQLTPSNGNQTIYFEKAGYISLTRNESLNQSLTINVSMISLSSSIVTVTTFSAYQGTRITTSNGSFVNLPGNNYIDKYGNSYTGAVRAQVVYINPECSEFSHQIDGSSYMIDEYGQFLDSYGVLRVDLFDANGNEIIYHNDSVYFKSTGAEIGVTIPQSKIANAPQSITLYSYDNNRAAYVASGTATQNGTGQFIGSVQHFSSWTCATQASIYSQGSAQYTINGGAYSMQTFSIFNSFMAYYHADTTGMGQNYTSLSCNGSDGYMYISFDNIQSAGTYSIGSTVGIHIGPPGVSQLSFSSGSLTITRYDNIGGLIEGTFSGVCSDGINTYNVTGGSFSMIRSPNQ